MKRVLSLGAAALLPFIAGLSLDIPALSWRPKYFCLTGNSQTDDVMARYFVVQYFTLNAKLAHTAIYKIGEVMAWRPIELRSTKHGENQGGTENSWQFLLKSSTRERIVELNVEANCRYDLTQISEKEL